MKLLLCLLPIIVQAQISIDIHTAIKGSFVRTDGEFKNIITDADENIFKISDAALKSAVSNLTGRVPTHVFLKGPTPWGDLYTTYNWPPVKTIVKPQRTTVINTETESVILNKKRIENNETVAKKQTITLTGRIEDRVITTWKTDVEFPVELSYNIDFNGLGKITKFDLKSKWGRDVFERQVSPIDKSVMEVTLEPQTNVSVVLTATRVTVEAEIEYVAMLDGHVATNNEVRLQGHHFWAYDIGSLMAVLDVPETVKAKEVVVIEFYTDALITVVDN